MGHSRFQRLSLVYLVSAIVPTASALVAALNAAHAVGLLSRQASVCGGDSTLEQCGSNLPSAFCCQKGSKCMRADNNFATSVICCPAGQDCSIIKPIICDIQQQNATSFPANPVHLTNLTISLPKCGDACCPLGFACQSGNCVFQPSSTSSSTSSLPSSTATSSPSASYTSSGLLPSTTPTSPVELPVQSSISSQTPSPSSSPNPSSFPAKAVLAGLFPGIALGILLTLAILWAIKSRSDSNSSRKYSGDFGPVSRTVSDPIYDPVLSARTDFLRRTPTSHSTSQNSTTPMVGTGKGRLSRDTSILRTPRVRSLFSRSPKLPQFQDSYTVPTPQHRSNYSTRRPSQRRSNAPSELNRNNSTETIGVLMPAPAFLQANTDQLQPPTLRPGPGHRPITQGTTFTSLMEKAGWEKDEIRVTSRR